MDNMDVKKVLQFGHSSQRGNVVLQIGIIILSLMIGAIGVDYGVYFAANNKLQTTADAAALAAAHQLIGSDNPDPSTRMSEAEDHALEVIAENLGESSIDSGNISIEFGTYDFENRTFSTSPYTAAEYNETGGYSAVEVILDNSTIPTFTAQLLGFNTMSNSVRGRAAFSGGVTDGTGLRPIYVCQAQVTQALADGDITNDTIRIYGDRFLINGVDITASCPPVAAGNWGFADLRDPPSGAPGSDELHDWFEYGFPGNVEVGKYYGTQSGNSINNGTDTIVEGLVNDGTEVQLPVINQNYSGGGSNVKAQVVDIVSFVFDDVVSNENAGGGSGGQGGGSNPHSRWYMEGHFVSSLCHSSNCKTQSGGDYNGSLYRVQQVQ